MTRRQVATDAGTDTTMHWMCDLVKDGARPYPPGLEPDIVVLRVRAEKL